MPGWPIRKVTKGGIKVTEATNGLGAPYVESPRGMPVTFVASGGIPLRAGGGAVDIRAAATARGIKFGMATDPSDFGLPATAAHLIRNADIIGSQNGFKPRTWWTAPATKSFTSALQAANFAIANGKQVSVHFSWGSDQYLPDWMKTGGSDPITSANWRSRLAEGVQAVAELVLSDGSKLNEHVFRAEMANENILYNATIANGGWRTGTPANGETGSIFYAAALASDGDGLAYVDYLFELGAIWFPNSDLVLCNGIVGVGNFAAENRLFIKQLIARLKGKGLRVDAFGDQDHVTVYAYTGGDAVTVRYNEPGLSNFVDGLRDLGVRYDMTELDFTDAVGTDETAFFAVAQDAAYKINKNILTYGATEEIMAFEARYFPGNPSLYPPYGPDPSLQPNAIARGLRDAIRDFVPAAPVTYDATTLAILNRTKTSLPRTVKSLLDQFIVGDKADGMWTKRVGLYAPRLFGQYDMGLCLTNPAYDLVWRLGTPAFVAGQGIDFGGNSYAGTNFNPVAAAGQFAQDAMHMFLWKEADDGAVTAQHIGNATAQISRNTAGTTIFYRANDPNGAFLNATADVGAGNTGGILIRRSLNNITQAMRSPTGAGVANPSVTSTGMTNAEIEVGRAGAGTVYSNAALSFFGFGGPVTSAEGTQSIVRLNTLRDGLIALGL